MWNFNIAPTKRNSSLESLDRNEERGGKYPPILEYPFFEYPVYPVYFYMRSLPVFGKFQGIVMPPYIN